MYVYIQSYIYILYIWNFPLIRVFLFFFTLLLLTVAWTLFMKFSKWIGWCFMEWNKWFTLQFIARLLPVTACHNSVKFCIPLPVDSACQSKQFGLSVQTIRPVSPNKSLPANCGSICCSGHWKTCNCLIFS